MSANNVGLIKQWATVLLLGLPTILYYLLQRLIILLRILQLNVAGLPNKRENFCQFNNGRMTELQNISDNEIVDFCKHRLPTYSTQLTFGCLWELSKFFGGQQTVQVMPDHLMRQIILNSAFCHGLLKGEEGSDIEWRFPFELDNHHLFEGFYWDVREIRLHRDRSLSIVDRYGNFHTPGCSSWSRAKAHAQSQMTFFGPGLAHNHVHFVFPSLMTCLSRTELSEDSVLRQLLTPHTQFTRYINYMALNVCKSSTNTRSLFDRLFRPWLSFPIRNEDFIGGVQRKCEQIYYEENILMPHLHKELPYHSFLLAYYDVIHKFVDQLSSLLLEDYEILSEFMADHLPFVRDMDMVTVISTLIWKSSVVHYCDHTSYLVQFAQKYGCMAVRHSLDSKANSTEEILLQPMDVYRTRCFLNIFVRYNPNPDLDLTLPATKYHFKHELAQGASNQFFRNLKDLDAKLREKGEDIIPVSQCVRTVCF